MKFKLRMTPEQMNAWISAMKSGDYKFGIGQFYHNECHCSLGVLCAINNIPFKNIVDGDDNYEELCNRFKFNEPRYMNASEIYFRNDGSTLMGFHTPDSYQPVIDFLKNNVECLDN